MSVRRLVCGSVVGLVAISGVLVFSAGPAVAITGFGFSGSFGFGLLNGPRSVAVDNGSGASAGDVYVTDNGERVVKFESNGRTQLGEFKFTPSAEQRAKGDQGLGSTGFVAVDPASGAVYVAGSEAGSGAVTKFSSGGAFEDQINISSFPAEKAGKSVLSAGFIPAGVAVSSSGQLYVADSTNRMIDRFGPAGVYETQFRDDYEVQLPEVLFRTTGGMAIDKTSGDVYINEGEKEYDGTNEILSFGSEGEPVTISSCSNNVVAGSESDVARAVAVDPADGALVIGKSMESGFAIGRYSVPCSTEPVFFGNEESGLYFPGFEGSHSIAVSGVAPAKHEVYAVSGNGVVNTFRPVGPVGAVTGAFGKITPGTAELCGTVNPGSNTLTASYQFLYGKSNLYGLRAPAVPVSIGTGTEEKEVCTVVEGLQSGETYHYRLLAEDEEGAATGVDQTFTTASAFNEITTGGAEEVTVSSAKLTGSLAPDGFDAHYYFQYGTSPGALIATSPIPPVDAGNGGSGCMPPGGPLCNPVAAQTRITGLTSSTTYYYRIAATNAYGTAYGEERSLTTLVAPPIVDGQSVSAVQQTTAVVDALVNPNNPTGALATGFHVQYGTSTAYGASMPVPDALLNSRFGDVKVGVQLTGLQPNTTYHYRIVATNPTATPVFGPDQIFTTLPVMLPVLNAVSMSEVSQNDVGLASTVDPQGVQTFYEFDLGVDTSYGTSVFGNAGFGSEPVDVSISFHGLAAGTTYHYRLVATNIYGTTYGPDETFTTRGYSTATLSAPVASVLLAMPTVAFPQTKPTAGTVKAKTRHKPTKKTRGKKRGRKTTRGIRSTHVGRRSR